MGGNVGGVRGTLFFFGRVRANWQAKRSKTSTMLQYTGTAATTRMILSENVYGSRHV